MKESTFMQAVCRKLPPAVHHQSMTGASSVSNGTPDQYFDYDTSHHDTMVVSDLWVEFKYATLTRNGINVGKMLTPLQKRWLLRRFDAGSNACVIVGVRAAHACGVVLEHPEQWDTIVSREFVLQKQISAAQLAQYIVKRLVGYQ